MEAQIMHYVKKIFEQAEISYRQLWCYIFQIHPKNVYKMEDIQLKLCILGERFSNRL